ncbi:MAG: cryptochrome/photolyase family protein [Kofleriaceae bacterium]|nr:cryptochrome/photolyase family protein [Kofleriaceae bacterium]
MSAPEIPKPRPANVPGRARLERVTVVLPWDLDPRLSAFPRTPRDGQLVVLETRAKPLALPFHRQKLALVVSALRHFVAERRAAGFVVEHLVADDYATGVTEMIAWAKPREVHAMEPREWAIDRRFRTLPITLHADGGPGGHFLGSREEFLAWARGRKVLRMEHFYPRMRRALGVLVDQQGRPTGGQWSFDTENRKHARGVEVPAIPWIAPDEITRAALRFAARAGRWGTLEPFGWPVTRADALGWLDDFIRGRLERFGPYEDAIRTDARFLFHSLLSVPLNLGLLHPRELVDHAVEAYRARRLPLASVEGFVRQVIGWREFIRGIYWHLMPGLREANQLAATRPLPAAFWEPERTELACLRDALASVRDTGYTHHIQRLMVICNYSVLAGLDPRAVSHWFWAAFVDAYEWVELPNVVGMGMFGTDAFTTKPYVASAAYIQRMAGGPKAAPCASCKFDPSKRTGPDACPLNAMYWDFLRQHRAEHARNPRMRVLLQNLDRMKPAELAQIRASAEAHRASLAPLDPPWSFEEDAG